MILKIGSRGDLVKNLQEFLGLKEDGVFGKGTEKAVMEWQSKNKLKADGIVGPLTWSMMGVATTDVSEHHLTTSLDIHTNFLSIDEYFQGPTKKEYLFIHHTAGWNNPYNTIKDWENDTRGKIGVEFVIGGPSIKGDNNNFDGEIVKAFPDGGYAWHLGQNGSQYMHEHSVGIEVCNFGGLKDGKTYSGTLAAESQIIKLSKPFRGYSYYHKYSDKQIETLKNLLVFIAERDNIDIRAGLPALIKEKGAAAFEWNEDAYYGRIKGLLTHTNVRKDKNDMFPQQELMDMLVSL